MLNRLKAHLGVFALAGQSEVFSPDYSVFRKRGPLEMEYFEKIFQLPATRTEMRIRAKGIVEGFGDSIRTTSSTFVFLSRP